MIELIQVAQETGDPKTRNREVRALIAASEKVKAKNLTLITMDENFEILEGGKSIRVVRVTDWLLGDSPSARG